MRRSLRSLIGPRGLFSCCEPPFFAPRSRLGGAGGPKLALRSRPPGPGGPPKPPPPGRGAPKPGAAVAATAAAPEAPWPWWWTILAGASFADSKVTTLERLRVEALDDF